MKSTIPFQSLGCKFYLEAINHYARVLVLDLMVHTWKPADYQSTFFGSESKTKSHVISWIDDKARDLSWVDEDTERPAIPVDYEEAELADPAWQECLAYLQGLGHAWLVDDTRGPL